MSILPKNIKEDLKLILDVCEDLKMSLYIVGGLPRTILFNEEINDDIDLDVTEKNGNAFDLAYFVCAKYGLKDPVIYDSSGTALINLSSGRKIEFHNSYHKVPYIIDELYSIGIEPTSLNKDIYSRDFTINTVIIDPVAETFKDITKKGISDIENLILRTPLSPIRSLSINITNILRGIRFKCQYGLNSGQDYDKAVEHYLPSLIEWVKNNPQSKTLQKSVEKAFSYNRDMAFDEFQKLDLIKYLPKNEGLDSIIKNNMFGTTISPQAQNVAPLKEGPTPMIRRLLNERENHKSYLRRKKRERQQYLRKKMEILEKAKSGYYNSSPEVTYLKNKERNIKRGPDYEYIKHPR